MHTKPPVDSIIFDMDGTLWDAVDSYAIIWNTTLDEAGIAHKAILDDALWETIRHHREIFTSVRDVDYSPDVRKRIRLLPPESVMKQWESDYDTMVSNMIYENIVPPFADILQAVSNIEQLFKLRNP